MVSTLFLQSSFLSLRIRSSHRFPDNEIVNESDTSIRARSVLLYTCEQRQRSFLHWSFWKKMREKWNVELESAINEKRGVQQLCLSKDRVLRHWRIRLVSLPQGFRSFERLLTNGTLKRFSILSKQRSMIWRMREWGKSRERSYSGVKALYFIRKGACVLNKDQFQQVRMKESDSLLKYRIVLRRVCHERLILMLPISNRESCLFFPAS